MQPDLPAAMSFYRAVFGWEFNASPDGSYQVALRDGAEVAGLGDGAGRNLPSSWLTQVGVDDLDAALAVATEAGGAIVDGPVDLPPAGRLVVVADPTGAPVGLWQAQERQGAQRVNEPSAWAMSLLRTGDPDRAASFYRAVFGWVTEAAGPIAMFRLPGYVGGEPLQPVPRDVVAALVPLDPDDGSARWDVDFWIDDCQAAAAAARAAGGQVLREPAEQGGFRQATLADPSGAVFSVSQLLGH